MLKGHPSKFAGRYADFMAGLRAEATRINYSYSIKWVLGADPDSFLALAAKNREKAERQLIEFIRKNRNRVASATIVNPVMAVRSFVEYSEVLLNWKKIRRELPNHQKVALDRGPNVEEIRKLLEVCDLRMKVAVLIMASSGVRVGAFDFLKLGDVKFLDSGIGRLTIYSGTPDRYYAFVSFEAVAALKEYLATREGVGEKLGPGSPVLRDKWDFDDRLRKIKRSTIAADIPTKFDAKNVRNLLGYLWIKSGVRERGIHRGEFQQAHGFRKFFKVQASKGIQRPEVVETLMGHVTNYFKVTPEELEAEYLGAQPQLMVSEAAQVRQEKKHMEEEHGQAWKDAQVQIAVLSNNYRNLADQYQGVINEVALMRDKLAKSIVEKEKDPKARV